MSKLIQEYFKKYTEIRFGDDVNDDAYNNLLAIESCVEDCFNKKHISPFELKVIQLVCQGYNFKEIARLLKVDRLRVSTTFKTTCSRIAFILGKEFTDDYLVNIYYGN